MNEALHFSIPEKMDPLGKKNKKRFFMLENPNVISQTELTQYSYRTLSYGGIISSEHFSGEKRENYFLIDRKNINGISFKGAKIYISIADNDFVRK